MAQSVVSGWEIAIKRALGKLDAPGDLEAAIGMQGFEPLLLTFHHAAQAGGLPPHHRGPFDRMLIVSGCRKARENGEHKMWGLTFSNFMFSHTGPLMAGSLLTAMDAPVSGGCVVSPEGP